MRISLIGAACAVALLAAPARAQDPNAARNLSAPCFTCHGTDGHSVGGIPPSLAGQSKDYLVKQMMDFKAGRRPATIMQQQARGYTDEQIEIMAKYFSSLKPGQGTPAPGAGGK